MRKREIARARAASTLPDDAIVTVRLSVGQANALLEIIGPVTMAQCSAVGVRATDLVGILQASKAALRGVGLRHPGCGGLFVEAKTEGRSGPWTCDACGLVTQTVDPKHWRVKAPRSLP